MWNSYSVYLFNISKTLGMKQKKLALVNPGKFFDIAEQIVI